MSNETPFTPFVPAPALLPEPGIQQLTEEEPAPRKRKSRQRKAAPAEPAPLAPTPRRQRKARTAPAARQVRQPRSMKLPVDTMLAALSELKGDDGALFEKMLGILNAAGKPQRNRVLAALRKVFS